MAEKDSEGSVAAAAVDLAKFLKNHVPKVEDGDERITAWLDLVADCHAAVSGKRPTTKR